MKENLLTQLYSYYHSLDTKNRFLLLSLTQMVIIMIELVLRISLLVIFEIILIITVLEKVKSNLYNFYTLHKPFLIRIGIQHILIAVILSKVGMLKASLLITLITFVYAEREKKEQTAQINAQESQFGTPSLRKSPLYRRSSLSKVLNHDEKWLDLLDQGYFLYNKDMKLKYTNKRGEQLMNELDLTFDNFIQRLIETEETNLTLKAIMEKLIASKDGDAVKAELSNVERRSGDNDPACSGDFLCNYKVRIWKLNSEYVFVIMTKKNKLNALTLSKSIKNAIISTLSHALKTVLNAIIGNLYLLEDSVKKCEVCVYNIALGSAHILSSKLDDLFVYIQIQDDNFKVHTKEFVVRNFVEHIGSICKCFAQQKNLGFSILVESEVPIIIKGDDSRLMQVILSVMMKTMDFIDFGQINLRVKLAKKNFITFQINAIGTGRHYAALLEMSRFSPKSRKNHYENLKDNPKYATENIEDMDLVIGKVIADAIGVKIKYSIKEKGHARLSLHLPSDPLEGTQAIKNSPRLIRKVISQDNLFLRKIEKNLLYRKKPTTDAHLCSIVEEFTRTRVKDINRFEELKNEDVEIEIPSECSLPEGIVKGKYTFNVNSMPNCKEKVPSIQLYPVIVRERSESIMNSKSESIKLESLNHSTRNRRKKRRTTMQEGTEFLSSNKLGTNTKCVEDLSSCNILIADDNMSNRFILKALLKKIGYNSIEAQDGSDAVNIVTRYINSGTIKDLLLIYMDLQMPIMNGIEATRSIIELCTNAGVSSPPIIGVTANSLEEDRYKFEQAGINEFLSKPIDKAKINATINRFIKRNNF